MRLVVTAMAVLCSVSAWSADPVDVRKKGFKAFKTEMGKIKEIVSSGAGDKQAQLYASAQALAKASKTQWEQTEHLFAQGTDKGDTEALPAIWDDFSAFRQSADKQHAAVEDFVVVAQTNDVAQWKKSFGQVSASCKGCHEKFKKD